MSSNADAYYQQIEQQIKELKKELGYDAATASTPAPANQYSVQQGQQKKTGVYGRSASTTPKTLNQFERSTKESEPVRTEAEPQKQSSSNNNAEMASQIGEGLGDAATLYALAPEAAAAAGALPAGTAALGAGSYAIPAGATVPAGYTAVGTAANGGTLVASNTSIGASAGGISTAAAGGIAAAVIAAYMTYRDRSKLKKQVGGDLTDEEILKTYPFGSYISKIPGVKTMWKYNPMRQLEKSIWGTTKSTGQVYRDRVRNQWKEHKLVDDNYQLKLADGSMFDIGKDGGATLTNLDGSTRRYKDIDWNNKLAADSVADVNPLGYMLTSGLGKDNTPSEIVGYLTNAVTSTAKDRAQIDTNIKGLYQQAGFKNRQEAYASLDGLVEAGKLSKEAAEAFKPSVNKYLPDAEAEAQPQQQSDVVDYEIPEEKPMSKKRLNSRFSTGFTANPVSSGSSTGVNSYLAMLEQMGQR